MSVEELSRSDLDRLSFDQRRVLRAKAEEELREMLWDQYDIDVRYPLKRKLFGGYTRSEGGKVLLREIEGAKGRLKNYSLNLFRSEEAEREFANAKWDEISAFLQKIGIGIPSDFNLNMVDLSELKNGEETRHVLKKRLSPSGSNDRVNIEVDGRYLIFSGQSIFLHSPQYHEPIFLAALDQLEKELSGINSLKVYFSETLHDLSHVNFTDYYNIEFGWKGWVFLTSLQSDYDTTVAPHILTVKEVLRELQAYRERKN